MKAQSKAFKDAGKNASAMGEIAGSFNILAAILQPFKPILDVLGSLLQVFMSGITAGLMPALQPLLERLVELAPVLLNAGIMVGQFIGALITFFFMLIDNQDTLLILQIILGVVGGFLISLVVPFAILGLIFEALIPLVRGVILFFAVVIDVLTFGVAGAVANVLAWFALLDGKEPPSPPPPQTTAGVAAGKIGEFQTGTPLITRTGPVIVHAGEAITSAGQVGNSDRLLEELIEETRQARKDMAFREAFTR